MAKILVVDDERVLVKGITFNLKNEGYQVETGYDGEEAVELAREGKFDLIILDLMMPKIDGLQACMRIREFSNVPIIMLTARSEDTDKIIGFECGADDYITKPFNILELKARVRALLRRSGAAVQHQAAGQLTVGHNRLDPTERSAWTDGVSVDLTGRTCSTWCGAMSISGTTARWTSMCGGCGKSWSWTRPTPSISAPSGGWATISAATPNKRNDSRKGGAAPWIAEPRARPSRRSPSSPGCRSNMP